MMNYYIAIYALYTDAVTNATEGLVCDMYCDGTFLDACDEAEAEIEWQVEKYPAKHIKGYRYEVSGYGTAYCKTIEA
jgi:hypothetical protein